MMIGDSVYMLYYRCMDGCIYDVDNQQFNNQSGYPSNIVPYSFLGKANLHSLVLILNALVPSNINSTITNHTNLDG